MYTVTWWLIVVLGLLLLVAIIWLGLGYWRPIKVGFDPKRINVEYQPPRPDPLLNDTQGILNLSYGDPAMYIPFWRREGEQLEGFPPTDYNLDPNFGFTLSDLLVYLYGYRAQVENIVMGNGSMQILAGYLTSVKQLVSTPEHRVLKLAINRPTMPILGDLVRSLGGIEIVDLDYEGHIDMEYIVTPNFADPLGGVRLPPQRGRYRLLDHAYAWPQYTDVENLGFGGSTTDRFIPDRGVEQNGQSNRFTSPQAVGEGADHLFSLSKGVGFAGFRCGFSVIRDLNLRHLVKEYIVNTTLGINTAGWYLGLQVVDQQHRALLERCIAYGKAVLASRWQRLLSVNDPALVNVNGAYAWFRRTPEEFMEAQIKVTRGSALLNDDQWSRVSMIGPQQTFDLFIARLQRMNPGTQRLS